MDRKTREMYNLSHDYNVNQYTIGHYTNGQRFFNGFAPKVKYGAITSGAALAVYGVATALTGGLFGLGVAAAVGASAAVGVVSQAAYTASDYAINLRKARFKNMGIGGEQANPGTIGLIKELEAEAYEAVQLLELQPNTKELDFNGKIYKRKALEKKVKEEEQVVYHGLKYILDQGLFISDQINALIAVIEKGQMSGDQKRRKEEALEGYFAQMDKISSCVKFVASQRSRFNPYKNLIVQYMTKGCLLGFNDEQNKQIRLLKGMNKDRAFQLYSNMYEMPVRSALINEREAILLAEKEIEKEYQANLALVAELIAKDFDIEKIKQSNRAKAKELLRYKDYMALIKAARNIINVMPSEMNLDKTKINHSVDQLKNAIISKDDKQVVAAAAQLDELIKATQSKMNEVFYDKGNKARKAQYDNLLKLYNEQADKLGLANKQVRATKQALAETKQKLSTERNKSRKLEMDLVDAWADISEMSKGIKADLDAFAEKVLAEYKTIDVSKKPIIATHIEWIKGFSKASKLSKEDEEQYKLSLDRLIKTLNAKKLQERQALEDELKEVEAERDEASMYALEGAHEARVNKILLDRERSRHASAIKRAWNWRAKNRTQEVENKDLKVRLADSEKGRIAAESERDKAFATIDSKAQEIKLNLTAIQNLTAEVAKAKEGEAVAKQEAKDARKGEKAANTRANKAEKNAAKYKEERDDFERKYIESEDHNAELVKGQTDNIETIIGLQVKNEKLEKAYKASKKDYKASEELNAQLGSDVLYYMDKLGFTTDQRDAYKEAYEDQLDQNKALKEEVEAERVRADKLQEDVDYRNYKRDLGGAVSRLKKLMDNSDAHARVSELATQSTNKDIKLVYAAVDSLRTQDLDNMPIDDLQVKREALKVLYNASKAGLVEIDSKDVSELGKKLASSIGKRENNHKR